MAKSGFKNTPSSDHAHHSGSSSAFKIDVSTPVKAHANPVNDVDTGDMSDIENYANDPANATDASDMTNGPDASTGAGIDQAQAYANDPANASGRTGAQTKDPSRTAGTSGQTGNAAGNSSVGGSTTTHTNATSTTNASSASAAKDYGKAGNKMSTPGAASKLSNAAEKVLGKKNRTAIKIAIVTGVILLSILGFFLTIPLKLMHIANVLFHNNFRTSDHIEQRAERTLLRSLFKSQLDDTTGHKSKTGKWMKDKMTNMRMDKFKDMLTKDGLKMEFDAKNRFIGVKDVASGKLITDDFRDKGFWEARRSMGDLVTQRLAPHRYLQHALYTKAMRLHAGVSFKFWVKNKAGDLKDRLISKVRRGLSGDADLESGRKASADGSADGKGGVGADQAKGAAEEADAQKSIFEKTKSMVAAHKAGISAFRAKAAISFGVTGIGMLYCMLYEMVQKALKDGYIARAVFLMREGNMLVTMAHQMYTGELNLDDFGEMMERFDGDDNAQAVIENPNASKQDKADANEDAKDFTKACAWKRATENGPCSTSREDANAQNYNPDLNEAANPDASVLGGLMAVLGDMFNIPGAKQVCSVLNSWFGWVIMGVELLVGVLDGEASTIAAQALKGVLVGVAIAYVVPKLLDAATGLAITGVENAVGTVNNGDAGLNLSGKDYGRMSGDRVGTEAETGAIVAAARAEDIQVANEKGWTYRTFAIDNNASIASKLIENAPTSPSGVVAAIRTTLAALPQNFAAIFVRPKYAFAADGYKDPYSFRSTVTTDAEIDKYDDPVKDIEDYLTADLPGTDKTRLQMLGDPTEYTPADGEDTNKNDLMHCFVSGFRTPYDEDKDDICHDLGVLTNRNAFGQTVKNPTNPGQKEIDKIYCEFNKVCGIGYNDDFTRYRLYLKYSQLLRAVDGLSTDTDPFAGKGVAPAAASGTCTPTDPAGCAKVLLASPNLTFNGYVASTGELHPELVKNDLVLTSTNTPIHNADSCNNDVILSGTLLYALYQATLKYQVKIDSFVTTHGGLCASYRYHPQGMAMDVWAVNGVRTQSSMSSPGQYNQEFAEYIEKFLPAGAEIAQANLCFKATFTKNISDGFDTCDHIHVSTGGK